MYLPLAFFVTLIVGLCFTFIPNRRTAVAVSIVGNLLLAGVAFGRAQVYRSGVSLWSDISCEEPRKSARLRSPSADLL